MADTGADGQDALRLLARAARALVEEGRLSVDGLLPAYRALAPALHPGAAADAVDVAAVQRLRSIGGDALLRARTIVVESGPPRSSPRVLPSGGTSASSSTSTPTSAKANDHAVHLTLPAGDDAAGDALATALALSLEAAKLAHGLTAPADALRAAFATPTDAKAAIDALTRGGSAREIVLAPARTSDRVDDRALALLVGDRPVYVVTGAGAWRFHDLLSPFARRLRTELGALGQARAGGARPSDDDVYAGTDALLADPRVLEERIAVERADGFVPLGHGAVVVKCESISDDVDRRAKEALVHLKRARALIVLVEGSAPSLSAALTGAGEACRAISVLVEGSGACVPSFVAESAGGVIVPIANALESSGTLTTIPSLALLPGAAREGEAGVVDATAFSLVQAVVHAWSRGALPAAAKLAVKAVPAGDVAALSRACIDVLARLGPKKAR